MYLNNLLYPQMKLAPGLEEPTDWVWRPKSLAIQ